MAARTVRNLSAVSRTLMTPLYIRAMESRRPDAIVHDPRALEVVGRLDDDFSLVRSRKKGDRVSMLMRMREFDRLAWEFLTQHPTGCRSTWTADSTPASIGLTTAGWNGTDWTSRRSSSCVGRSSTRRPAVTSSGVRCSTMNGWTG
jgi:hypothetical protein